ncbi:MAG: CDP-alcohol phosphatidyltransferase family protein [Pyrinomonadaceae bacterium]
MADEKDDRPPHRGIKKGLYVIPTLFTAANVAMGYLAILSSIRGFHLSASDPALAATYFNSAGLAIGLAILFDTVDGRVARATRTATEIGVQFDSLADVLTFGIAPTALIYAWAIAPTFAEGSFGHNLGVFLLFMYLMCGAFRLARFNLQATRPVKLIEGATKVDKKAFVGLPIPPAGGLLAALVHFAPAPLSSYGADSSQSYTYALYALVAVLAITMVSTIRYNSMKTAGKGRQGFLLVLVLVAMAMGVWLYSRYALLIIAGLYVSHGLIWWVFRFIGSKLRPQTSS